MLPCARGFRDGDFGLGMKRPLAADRREDDRRIVGRAEQRHRQVRLGDVDQPADAKLIAGECFPVRADGVVGVGSRGQVAEVRGRKRPPGDGLEVEDVERVFDLGDDRRVIARGLRARQALAKPTIPSAPAMASGLAAAHRNSFRRAARLVESCLTSHRVAAQQSAV